jgi:hypothetical protein
MDPNIDFAEQVQVVSGFIPVNMATAANNGDYISMKGYERCTVLFFKAVGTAGDDPTITLDQATAVAGTGTKTLAVIDKVYTKQGADLTAVGINTVVTQAAAATYTDATSAELAAIWQFDVLASDLDVDNGFDCFRAVVGDVGTNAQLGCLLYLLWPPRYGKQVLTSAIVD